MTIDYSGIPEHMQPTMKEYIEHRIPPGSFLQPVLENDLRTACEMADDENRYRLFDYIYFLYHKAPSECWGSPEKVHDWLNGTLHRGSVVTLSRGSDDMTYIVLGSVQGSTMNGLIVGLESVSIVGLNSHSDCLNVVQPEDCTPTGRTIEIDEVLSNEA